LKYVFEYLRRRGIGVAIDEDMVFLLTHMYAVSTGEPPMERLFRLKNISGRGYSSYTRVLSSIATLSKRWGYNIPQAVFMKAKEASNSPLGDFLNRLSEALRVGENIDKFLEQEQTSALVGYEATYSRTMEALKLLLGIYIASMSSAVFVNVNVIMMAFFMGGSTVIIISFIATIIMLAVLVFIVSRSSPRERLVHDMHITMPEMRRYRLSFVISLMLASISSSIILLFFREYSYSLIVFGSILIIPGAIGRRLEDKVKKIESIVPAFMRSFGLTFATVRNYAYTIRSMLVTGLGVLTNYLKRLHARLKNGIDSKIAFLYFIGETGSETVRKSIDIFYDAVESGGDPVKTGEKLSITVQKILNLRKQREQVAGAFQGIMYVMTMLVVALAQFVAVLVIGLRDFLESIAGQVAIFEVTPVDPSIVQIMSTILMFSIAILNGLTLYFARGGFIGSTWLHAGLLMILAGITMKGASALSQAIYELMQVPQITIP